MGHMSIKLVHHVINHRLDLNAASLFSGQVFEVDSLVTLYQEIHLFCQLAIP
jgi:hypothetical protein